MLVVYYFANPSTCHAIGLVGCIIHSDLAEIGFHFANDTVQRGAVSLMNWVVGDTLSSGFPSFPEEAQRNFKDGNSGLANIPSVFTINSWVTTHILLTKDSFDASKSSHTNVLFSTDITGFNSSADSTVVARHPDAVAGVGRAWHEAGRPMKGSSPRG